MSVKHLLLGMALLCTLGSSALARAATMKFTDVSDATITDTDGNGTFDSMTSGGYDLSIRNFDKSVLALEDQAVIEFDLRALPDDANVQSVAFEFYTDSYTYGSAGDSKVTIFGGQGNGTADMADASVSSFWGSYTPTATGDTTVPLGIKGIASVESDDYVVLCLVGQQPTNVQIAGMNGLVDPVPTLDVTYTAPVPEPATAGLVLIMAGGVLLCRRPRTRIG